MTSTENSFIDFISNGHDITNDVCKAIESKILIKKVKKKELLQRKGDTNLKAYYVKSGLLKSYTIDENGKEHIFMFAPEKWIISDINSLAIPGVSDLFVQAIENTEVEVISPEIFQLISDDKNNSHLKEVIKLHRRNAVLQKRIISLMSQTAIERYNDFIKTYPGIVQRVPQKMIASYLGITPQALSKSISQASAKR